MSDCLSVAPIVRDMLRNAGIEAYDVAPSARDAPCPVVICNERYERGDTLDDCEYGTATIDVIAVRETRDECLSAIGSVVYALHEADWEPWSGGRVSIRSMSVVGMPEEMPHDGSGRFRMKANILIDVCAIREGH
ncbi:hypothetical protein [Xiamenia xianingshaonis]|uniref:DUF3168 domain-containing protein n=1 Tax=Xiamenia xianingshaonis TaxID=2682776 RepID=A0A9E6MR91_9ACTN|nr:hypothetical protein [Xiamenia xianingshaonis]NHM14445.1 DUF3168 domain-containing protein [Xiamenia xianingshaonis]QTU84918.1 hypothetical protein J7S26_03135 [Xiamenia xianingshaonis]